MTGPPPLSTETVTSQMQYWVVSPGKVPVPVPVATLEVIDAAGGGEARPWQLWEARLRPPWRRPLLPQHPLCLAAAPEREWEPQEDGVGSLSQDEGVVVLPWRAATTSLKPTCGRPNSPASSTSQATDRQRQPAKSPPATDTAERGDRQCDPGACTGRTPGLRGLDRGVVALPDAPASLGSSDVTGSAGVVPADLTCLDASSRSIPTPSRMP